MKENKIQTVDEYINQFEDEVKEKLISEFKTNTKNTIQLPLNKELPLDLIKNLVLFRIDENENKNK